VVLDVACGHSRTKRRVLGWLLFVNR